MGFNCIAGGEGLADLLVHAMKEKRGGTYEDVVLFVKGHATTLMWVYQQQSECRSWGVGVSVCTVSEQGVKLTSEHAHPRTCLSTVKPGFMSAVNCESQRDRTFT